MIVSRVDLQQLKKDLQRAWEKMEGIHPEHKQINWKYRFEHSNKPK